MGQTGNTEYYLDLRTDYGFKRVFGENPEILKSLLNEFLHEVIGRKITDVVYLQTEVLGFSNKEKRIIFDLYCEDQIMNRMIVEMQRAGVLREPDAILYGKEHQQECEAWRSEVPDAEDYIVTFT